MSWLAVRGKSVAELGELLSIAPTGEVTDRPSPKITFSATTTPLGWAVLVIRKYNHEFVRDKTLERISTACDVMAVWVEEHVMFCRASFWAAGEMRWSVIHEGENDRFGVEESGELPAEYAGIKAYYFKEQASAGEEEDGVDLMFEIPLRLAESIAGYKHDAGADGPFEVMKSTVESRGFFQRLLGR